VLCLLNPGLCAHPLNQLIERDPNQRLGCKPNGQGIEDVRQHPWFQNIEWDQLENKESQPSFVPDVRDASHVYQHATDMAIPSD
jgi:serine/threonine kinase 32